MPRQLDIGLLAPSFRGFNALDGGIGSHFADLATALAADGHAVRVITPAAPADLPLSALIPGVEFVAFDSTMPRWLHRATSRPWQLHTLAGWRWRARRAAAAVRSAHASRPFDCIETSSSGLLGLTLVNTPSPRRPPVVTRISTTAAQLVAHNAGSRRWVDHVEQSWERHLALRSDAIVTHTAAHRDEVCRLWALPPSSLHLVPHGIAAPTDDELPSPASSDRARVLYVGRFEHRKGIDVLLAAIPGVLAVAPEVTFLLVGDDRGDYWQQRFWRENPAVPRERVHFTGKTSDRDLRAAYRDCDLFVAPSRYESFGLIYVEAMVWGKPVIGCRAGGIPEVVAEGETGLLVAPDNVIALRDALVRLSVDTELRTRLGRQARARAINHFSLATLARNSVALYREIVAPPVHQHP